MSSRWRDFPVGFHEAPDDWGIDRDGVEPRVAAIADYAFLGLDSHVLVDGVQRAMRTRLPLHRWLIGSGSIDARDYVDRLARSLGAPLLDTGSGVVLVHGEGAGMAAPRFARLGHGYDAWLVVDATEVSPADVAALMRIEFAAGRGVVLAAGVEIRAMLLATHGRGILRTAIGGLATQDPASSAASGLWLEQRVVIAVLVGLFLGLLAMTPDLAVQALAVALAGPFVLVVTLQLTALLVATVAGSGGPLLRPRVADGALPVYSVMVPLYRETRVLTGLLAALRAIDYPAAKLDIKLVLEAADTDMIAAVVAQDLLAPFDVIIVPDAAPRTKPKALNYALAFIRGSFVTIFDAEDIPEPGQLREALHAFDRGGAALGCVQARLAVDNEASGWLARQFAVEYLALFDGLLPALARLGLPMPLGGTSNHFPVAVVKAAGGWDAFNVTEDADLGLRLARFGYRCGVIGARTYEEAPFRFGPWLRQRTRWMKGWMQTLIVNSRRPLRLAAAQGLTGMAAAYATMGGVVLSALLHPFCLAVVGVQVARGLLFAPSNSLAGDLFAAVALVNLIAGYGAAMLLAVLVILRRRAFRLLPSVLMTPLYWLLISAAAYRALWQLGRDPFGWEKTEHGLGKRRTPVVTPAGDR